MSERSVVGVLLGGTSAEREVSLASGAAVAAALEDAGWPVVRYDYGAEGEKAHGSIAGRLHRALHNGDFSRVDVVFNALHGGVGEDGRVQAFLELAGVPYTGSGVLASSLTMDKWLSKNIFRQAGITVPDGRLWREGEPAPESIVEGDWGASLGWPLVVKPADQGSTVGLSLVEKPADVPDALREAARFGERVLLEQYIAGREVTVAVVEDRALPVIEISPSHDVYDYECKYTSGMSSYDCPADLPEEITLRLQAEALQAFTHLMHRDYSRMDFRLTEEGTPYLLEGNTLPGFTATSLVPKAAEAAGIGFADLCSQLVEASLKRGGEHREGGMIP